MFGRKYRKLKAKYDDLLKASLADVKSLKEHIEWLEGKNRELNEMRNTLQDVCDDYKAKYEASALECQRLTFDNDNLRKQIVEASKASDDAEKPKTTKTRGAKISEKVKKANKTAD